MVAKIRVVVMSSDFNQHNIVIVTKQLKVFFSALLFVQLFSLESWSSVHMIKSNDLPSLTTREVKLVREPTLFKFGFSCMRVWGSCIINVTVHWVHVYDSDISVRNIHGVVTSCENIILHDVIAKTFVASKYVEPLVVKECVVVCFVCLIDGLTVVSTVVVSNSW